MNAKEIISKIEIRKDWQNTYNSFIPKFIDSVKTKESWREWDKDIFAEFFERGRNQCVSSLSQKYFDKEEQSAIKENWNELGPMLKELAESQDSPNFKLYVQIRDTIRKWTKENKKAATNRLIASLQPNNLCTVINENSLNELISLMNSSQIPDSPQKGEDWFHTSNNVLSYFKAITGKDVKEICTIPWQFYQILKYGNNNNGFVNRDIDEVTDECVTLLTSNHNLILTGAPGTGKTYLAKELAKAMGCNDDEIGFVQFHPSYDYTDFVEGLRPIQDDNTGSVGFERKDGVFKEFCRKALKNLNNSKNPNDSQNDSDFETAYEKLLDDVSNGDIKEYETYGGSLPVYVNNKGLLEYEQKNTTRTKTTNKTYLKILFEKFKNKKSDEILKLSRDEMENVVRDSDCGIKTIDYIQYRWALSKIVSNLGSNDEHSKVSSVEKKSFVFIIDEINRGEISKIFGELFFSIDPGYRGVDENGKPKGLVKTQYQNLVEVDDDFYKGFFIPENVYIIGTMNDIDRSVESMDFAFRRRFAFKEIKADENVGMLDNLDASVKDKAINRMKNLNNAISQIEGLSSAYHIGGSYFLKLKNYDNNFDNLWDYHIEGLLREYLRGNPEIEKQISDLKTAYDNED